MKTNKNTAASKANANANATDAKVNAGMAAGLESAAPTAGVDADGEIEMPQYDNMVWLAQHDPTPYFNPEVSTNKYDPEREPKIAAGLVAIAEIAANVPTLAINPLMLLLAKWWEVKPARAEIKKAIYAEATQRGYMGEDWMQNHIGKEIERYSNIAEAVARLNYAKTMYKPRREIKTNLITTAVRIEGQLYDVPRALYNELVESKTDRETMKAKLLEVAVKREVLEIPELD